MSYKQYLKSGVLKTKGPLKLSVALFSILEVELMDYSDSWLEGGISSLMLCFTA